MGGSNKCCGQEFNYGVEFVLLISFIDGVSRETVEHALTSLALLTSGSPSLIVQSTQGRFCQHPKIVSLLYNSAKVYKIGSMAQEKFNFHT